MPLRDFDVVGFSLGYELTYTNVLNVLDLSGIPLLSPERGEGDPIVIAGGSCAVNPEPMADFIDLFVIGEAEGVIGEISSLLREWKTNGNSRDELLRAFAQLDGVYVPRYYRAEFDEVGYPYPVRPFAPEATGRVRRLIVDPLPDAPMRPIVPHVEIVHDRAWVEIQRGCTRGCNVCGDYRGRDCCGIPLHSRISK